LRTLAYRHLQAQIRQQKQKRQLTTFLGDLSDQLPRRGDDPPGTHS